MPFSPGSFSGNFTHGPVFEGNGNFSGGSFSGAIGGFSVDEEAVDEIQPLVGGGYNPSQGLYPRPPSRRQVSRDRERLGLLDELALKTIAEVAARQAERLEQDAQKRFEELSRELQLRGLEWEARYLETLNAKREELIDAEILSRLKAKFRADDEMIVLMLLAASI
jgi:hypothetical protein